MRHALHVATVIIGGIAAGKMCQYAAAGWLEPRFGFDLASLVGVAPFIGALLWLKIRHPRVLGYRPRASSFSTKEMH